MNKTHKKRLEAFKRKQKRKTGYLGSDCIATPNGKTTGLKTKEDFVKESNNRASILLQAANNCTLSETLSATKSMSDGAIARLYRCTEAEYRKRHHQML